MQDLVTLAGQLATPIGVILGLLVIIWTGSKGVWVFGWVYKAKCAECDRWQALATQGTKLVSRAIDVVERPPGSD